MSQTLIVITEDNPSAQSLTSSVPTTVDSKFSGKNSILFTTKIPLCLSLQIDYKETESTGRSTSSRVCKNPGVQASIPAGAPQVIGTAAAGLGELVQAAWHVRSQTATTPG